MLSAVAVSILAALVTGRPTSAYSTGEPHTRKLLMSADASARALKVNCTLTYGIENLPTKVTSLQRPCFLNQCVVHSVKSS